MPDPTEKLIQDISAGNIKPAYLFCGNQRFLYLQALERILAVLLEGQEKELSLITYQPEKHTLEQVLDGLATYSLFSARTVVLIKDTHVFLTEAKLGRVWKKGMDRWLRSGAEPERRRSAHLILGVLGKLGLPLETLSPDAAGQGLLDELEQGLRRPISGSERETLSRMYDVLKEGGEKPDSPDDDAAFIARMLDRGIPEGNTLILTTDQPDKRSALFKMIKKIGAVVELSDDASPWKKTPNPLLEAEVDKLLGAAGKTISSRARRLLDEKIGGDAGKFIGELEKVIAFAGDRKRIETKDIQNLVSYSRVEKIFNISEALGRRNLPGALKTMNRFFETESQAGAPLQLLAHLYNQVRAWLQARYIMARAGIDIPPGVEDFRRLRQIVAPVMEDVTEKAPLAMPGEEGETFLSGFYSGNPNRFMFLFRKAANFTGEELEKAVDLLERADLQIKTGRIPPAAVLEQTLIAICQK